MIALNPPFRAANMDGLYKAVLSGSYAKVPPHYSTDLAAMIRLLLQVAPHKRPNCDQILNHELVKKRINAAGLKANSTEDLATSLRDDMLRTIHCPRNLSQLGHLLPRSKY